MESESFTVRCDGASVKYAVGDFKDIGLKEYIIRRIKGDFESHELYANKNITFTLKRGDMLGIIGRNGAGKSTLLKAISKILLPCEGKIETKGKISALLELASGFDGDLTVRENTYLRGAMLGYGKNFINEKYRDIIDFAELSEAEDRPLKQLSSGMKSRIAFSIASLVEPDILILDEVLAVGDGGFREKSAKRMQKIIENGATTIFVSHSLGDVKSLCNKVLYLDKGEQKAFGEEVDEICDMYEKSTKTP